MSLGIDVFLASDVYHNERHQGVDIYMKVRDIGLRNQSQKAVKLFGVSRCQTV